MDSRNLSMNTRMSPGCSIAAILLTLFFVAITMSTTMQPNEAMRKVKCQSNMKSLALAFQMYLDDYNGMLPSSVLRQVAPNGEWDAGESAQFCTAYDNQIPEEKLSRSDITWIALLAPYSKNKAIVWCPSDPNRRNRERDSIISYIYKPAIDRACFGSSAGARESKDATQRSTNRNDFKFQNDQMLFFEHSGWHWGDQKRGWSSNPAITLNCAYLDGHVRATRLRDAIGCPTPKNAKELAQRMSSPGEPLWFNKHVDSKTTKKACWFDPKVCYDELP